MTYSRLSLMAAIVIAATVPGSSVPPIKSKGVETLVRHVVAVDLRRNVYSVCRVGTDGVRTSAPRLLSPDGLGVDGLVYVVHDAGGGFRSESVGHSTTDVAGVAVDDAHASPQ